MPAPRKLFSSRDNSMAKYNIVRRMPYSARQLFDMTSDVASYPKFLPLCAEARVWDEKDDGSGITASTASLRIIYDKLKMDTEFISEVLANAENLTIRAVSNSGPVRQMENRWRFVDLPDTGECDVEFSIEYEMSSRPMQFVMSTMFDHATRKMMAAFERRARELYGPSGQQAAR